MLVWVRKLLGNWVAKVLGAVLVAAFVFWGIANVQSLTGGNTSIASVGGVNIDAAAVQAAYQSALNQASQSGQGQPSLAERQQLAGQALADAIRKQLLLEEEHSLGVAVPDAAIRQVIDTQPAFQTNGVFDKTKFDEVLAQNSSAPDQYLDQIRNDLSARQLLYPIMDGVAPSASLVNQLFSFIAEQRTAETVQIPAAAQTVPPAPDADVLQRYWRNHPDQFTAPEYRQIKLVILSPALLAPSEQIPQADIDAAYARVAGEQPSVPQRSVQIITVQDLASSSRLQAAWRRGASWDKMQAMAKNYGATAIELDNASQAQIPSPDLAAAVFSASPGKVTGPVAGTTSMYIFKVTGQGLSGPDPAALRAQVTQELQQQKAQADVAQDVDAVQDALAGQTPLDQLPGNLGLTAVQGTLDASGNTPDGVPAPIPGSAALKTAIVQAAFAAHPGDPAQLTNGPDGSYFALTVDKIEPPSLQPFAQIQAKVLAAWQNDAMSREAEVKAAALLHAVTSGQSLDAAASAAGLQAVAAAPVTRQGENGAGSQLTTLLFSLSQGQATMLQTDTGFTVAQLTKITDPDPAQDQADYAQLQQAMTKSLQDDTGESFLAGLQLRGKVTVNQTMLAQIYQ